MIKAIELYLITDNNGLEAIGFYQDVFDAEVISVQTYGEAIPDTPEEMKDLVLNANLSINGIPLQLSDNGLKEEYIQGTNMTACLQLDSAEAAKHIYDKLVVGAKSIALELQATPWSPAYANVTDKFGMTWQINAMVSDYVAESANF